MSKIGVSTNPNARLASLRTASAFPIDFAFVAVTPGTGFDIERRAHEMLAHHRRNGEWFDVSPDMAVAALCGAAHGLGHPLQPIKAEWIDQILQIGAAQDAASASRRSLFFRLPLTLKVIAVLAGLTLTLIASVIVIAIIAIITAPPLPPP